MLIIYPDPHPLVTFNTDEYDIARTSIVPRDYDAPLLIVGAYPTDGRTQDFATVGVDETESYEVLRELCGGFDNILLFDFFPDTMTNKAAGDVSATWRRLPQAEQELVMARFQHMLSRAKACSIVTLGALVSERYQETFARQTVFSVQLG